MVRTLISLDTEDKAWLDRVARAEGVPMTKLVRRAIHRLRKEQEYIGYIIKVFEHKGPRTQFPVERYRIDLYFPAERVAVECDEYGHRDRCPVQEATREQFIAARLGCRFVRFNPDAPAFCVFDTIREIMQALDVSP